MRQGATGTPIELRSGAVKSSAAERCSPQLKTEKLRSTPFKIERAPLPRESMSAQTARSIFDPLHAIGLKAAQS
jgi:hypothetical protein